MKFSFITSLRLLLSLANLKIRQKKKRFFHSVKLNHGHAGSHINNSRLMTVERH